MTDLVTQAYRKDTYLVGGSKASQGTRAGDPFSNPPGAPVIWGAGGNTHIGWSQSNGSESGFSWDLAIGDIYGHTYSNAAGSIEMDWTSPVSGQIEITGGAWMLRDWGRAVSWSLTVGSTTLDSGSLFSGDAYSRSNPDTIHALFSVNPGDIVRFQAYSSDVGDYVGLDLNIQTCGVPEPTTMLLLGLGLVGTAGLRRKFKN